VNVVRFAGRVAAVKQAGAFGFLEHGDDTSASSVDTSAASSSGVAMDGRGSATSSAAAATGVGGYTTGKQSEVAAGSGVGTGAAVAHPSSRHAATGKTRVFFHGSDVEGGATLKEGDEVSYCLSMSSGGGDGGGRGRGRGPSGGGGGRGSQSSQNGGAKDEDRKIPET